MEKRNQYIRSNFFLKIGFAFPLLINTIFQFVFICNICEQKHGSWPWLYICKHLAKFYIPNEHVCALIIVNKIFIILSPRAKACMGQLDPSYLQFYKIRSSNDRIVFLFSCLCIVYLRPKCSSSVEIL